MITCLIVDDEYDAIDVMTHYVAQTPILHLAGATTNPLEALQIIATQKIDLVFLDIQMPQLSGMDLVKAIDGKTKVILTTAYSEFAVEAYSLEVVDYLLKPVPFPRFLAAVQRAAKQVNEAEASAAPEAEEDYIFVKTESKGKLLKIELADIEYIEAANNYVAVHQGGKKTLVYTTMKELEERLPKKNFIRVHKSFIVPVAKITGIEGNKLLLKASKADIIIGESYKPQLMDIIRSRMVE
ncbi:MAG TPA: LytTR family DNA-binding domain-containing protein [Flavisolibacter sp.]|jgi:DNA-binding LytR/AlgR family response regulator|nr:LytTR family DNA-binding domain-containing protein [Flavisolibacter sp.]